ncbi:hypothetical protein GW17_00028692 [Ensete ventricosum]|nr:hypothetical protein GW17_00028692 [Ensete ventricosum]
MGSTATTKTSPGESPYSLAFGTKVVLPPEVVFLTLRIENFTLEVLETGLRENLDMLEERRAEAHLKTYTTGGQSDRIPVGLSPNLPRIAAAPFTGLVG